MTSVNSRKSPLLPFSAQQFAEAVPHAVVVTDAHGRVEYANPAWFAWTAQKEEDTYRLDGWLSAFESADMPSVASNWASLLSSGEPFEIQARLHHAVNDTSRWFLARAVSLRDEKGFITHWVVSLTDVEEMRRDIEISNRELDEFCYTVSHDLRTPLRAIDGFTKTILDEDGDLLSESGRGSLGRIRAAAGRMDGLITALLTLARVSRSEVVPVPVDLSLRVSRITEHARRPAITFSISEGLRANCDSKLVDLLLQNLIDNAIKFTSEVPNPHIEFGRATSGDGTVAFFVRDNGIGFDPRFRSRLFKPFERLHGNTFPGSGIGLAIVQKIVAKHGGQVWADGAEGAGATIWFVLPG